MGKEGKRVQHLFQSIRGMGIIHKHSWPKTLFPDTSLYSLHSPGCSGCFAQGGTDSGKGQPQGDSHGNSGLKIGHVK